MKKIRFIVLIIVLILSSVARHYAAAEIPITEVTRAIQRYVCFQVFWNAWDQYRLGHSVTITLHHEPDAVYAWSESLSTVQHVKEWADFFVVVGRGDQVLVSDFTGFNVDIMSGEPNFRRDQSLAFKAPSREISILLPANCTPHPLPTEPLKTLMLSVVEKTIANQILSVESDKVKPGSNVRIVIADFDPDYPWTYVFVPETGEMWIVSLRSKSDPFGDQAISDGEYPAGLVYSKRWIATLKEKLASFGIVRQIEIGDR